MSDTINDTEKWYYWLFCIWKREKCKQVQKYHRRIIVFLFSSQWCAAIWCESTDLWMGCRSAIPIPVWPLRRLLPMEGHCHGQELYKWQDLPGKEVRCTLFYIGLGKSIKLQVKSRTVPVYIRWIRECFPSWAINSIYLLFGITNCFTVVGVGWYSWVGYFAHS